MQKLMISKQIMDRHDTMGRGQNGSGNHNTPISESTVPQSYNETPIPATYNIPQEFLQTTQSVQPKQVPITEDRIKNSKLPDSIKKLMMEHPIQQPQSYQPTISNEIIEKAARLMGENKTITQTSQTVNTKHGWAQAHFNQFKNDGYQFVNYNKTQRKFIFQND